MRIIGIDPSLTGTGIAVVNFRRGRRPRLMHSRRVETTPKWPMPVRLSIIFNAIQDHALLVEAAGVETGLVLQARNVAMALAQVRGVALYALHHCAVREIHDINYSAAKRMIGVPNRLKSAESKARVHARVRELVDGVGKDLSYDETDAIAHAIAVHEIKKSR